MSLPRFSAEASLGQLRRTYHGRWSPDGRAAHPEHLRWEDGT